MPGHGDQPPFIARGEMARGVFRAVGRGDAVGLAVQRDGGHADGSVARPARSSSLPSRIARRVGVTVAVGLDGDLDEILVVEAGRGLREGRLVESPVRDHSRHSSRARSRRLARNPARPRSVWNNRLVPERSSVIAGAGCPAAARPPRAWATSSPKPRRKF